MALHLIKLAAGAEGVDELQRRIDRSVAANEKAGRGVIHSHETRMFPRRGEELLDRGSLYWVIKGVVLVRQRIIGLESRTGTDGARRCAILLDPEPVPTEAQPRRAFQGWRYLNAEDAPRDLSSGKGSAPPALRARLAELGLL